MRIALFTPFSPDTGGGAAQLRSHVAQLPDLEVEWYYLAAAPAKGARWHWLGNRFTPLQLLSDLSRRAGFLPGSKARAKKLAGQMDADLYWVVGHYEGICVAAQLCEMGKKVHLTVHDDPFGTWTRSELYRFFVPLLTKIFPRVLRAASSIDVTSWAMRDLYREKYGVRCFALYLHVPKLPAPSNVVDPRTLTIGHIGTLYQAEPFRTFLSACCKIAAEQEKSLRIIRIGDSPEMDAVAREHPEFFESHGDLPEAKAIPLLARCDILYAMYPEGKRYELFRRTSLPVKLSTYIQAQRPIFAHTPLDSTLARALQPFRVSCVCSIIDETVIANEVRVLLDQNSERDEFEKVRHKLMGCSQLQQLESALSGADWTKFPESGF